MKINCSNVAKWMAQLLLCICLVTVMSGVASAYTIYGTVTNNTARTGRVYLALQQYGSDTGLGVSIPSPAPNTPFTIRGIPNGSYTLKAFVDGSGTGLLHANDPTWTSSGTININNFDHTVDPTTTVVFNSLPILTLLQPAGAKIIPGDNGAFVGWGTPTDSNGSYIADSYKVYWSTNTGASGIVTVPGGDQTFAVFNYPNGTTLNVQVTALVGATESAATTATPKTINPPTPSFSISG